MLLGPAFNTLVSQLPSSLLPHPGTTWFLHPGPLSNFIWSTLRGRGKAHALTVSVSAWLTSDVLWRPVTVSHCVPVLRLWRQISFYCILCISFKKLTLGCDLDYILNTENTKISKGFLLAFLYALLFTSKHRLPELTYKVCTVSACHHTINIFYVALFLKLWDSVMEKDSWSIAHNWFSYSLWTGCSGHLHCCYGRGWRRSPRNLCVCCKLSMRWLFKEGLAIGQERRQFSHFCHTPTAASF